MTSTIMIWISLALLKIFVNNIPSDKELEDKSNTTEETHYFDSHMNLRKMTYAQGT